MWGVSKSACKRASPRGVRGLSPSPPPPQIFFLDSKSSEMGSNAIRASLPASLIVIP